MIWSDQPPGPDGLSDEAGATWSNGRPATDDAPTVDEPTGPPVEFPIADPHAVDALLTGQTPEPEPEPQVGTSEPVAEPAPEAGLPAVAGDAGVQSPAAPAGPEPHPVVELPVGPADPEAAPEPDTEPDPVAIDEQFLAAMAAEFDAIEAALVRLDDGSFDRCQMCGGRISQEQLVADPLSTRCPAHA